MKSFQMHKTIIALVAGLLVLLYGCGGAGEEEVADMPPLPGGKLFIIGGGKKPPAMVQEMVRLADLDKGGYGMVLPFASSEPDTAFHYARLQFEEHGAAVYNFRIGEAGRIPASRIDSLVRASLIYLPGGEQDRFMETLKGTPVTEALRKAYQRGAVIAGTSAGAAVMSQKMITGNEYKHPEYTGDFRTIEAENMELAEGLGFLEKAIIDQHFIWRMRNNRLISVAIENPGYTCVGIDESTAIIVEGDKATVTGLSQVIVLKSDQKNYSSSDGLLGAEDIRLGVYLPGQTFTIGR